MQQKGMEPDPATLLGVLNVCASVVVMKSVGLLTNRLLEAVLKPDVFVWAIGL
jgi:hypothetical protein